MSDVETGEDLSEKRITKLRRLRAIRESHLLEPELSEDQLPIVYDNAYNISFFGLEKLHPFDAGKWGNVVRNLVDSCHLSHDQLVRPMEATYSDLRLVHPPSYLRSLQCPCFVAKCVELTWVSMMPSFLIDRRFLKAMRYHTGGTVLAAHLALQRGWAINVGGGFHHAHSFAGGGFCVYADISIAIRFLKLAGAVDKVMIVDLDAHQGNGHERDFKDEESVYILDMFNYEIYPHDFKAKESIRLPVRLESYTKDVPYLTQLKKALKTAFTDFKPDVVVYNAGSDVLDGDPVGCLGLSETGMIRRDEMVFNKCKEEEVPIVMLLSGGYTPQSARAISNSIANLFDQSIIS